MAPCASACAAALFLACAGCTLISPDVEIAVEIPPLPDAWAQSLSGVGFTLVYLDGDGARAETTIAAGERSAAIRTLKASCSPILAFPWASSAPVGVLRPAGGFAVPEGGQAALRWEDGPLTLICLTLREAGLDPASFNVERLGGYLADRVDPWEWDLSGICQDIAAGTFTANDVDPLPLVEVTLHLAPGEWVLETPFGSSLHAAGEPLTLELPRGMHALFSPGARVDAYAY